MRRIMNDNQINNIISSKTAFTKGLNILNPRPLVGSVSENDEFSSEEMKRFLMYCRALTLVFPL